MFRYVHIHIQRCPIVLIRSCFYRKVSPKIRQIKIVDLLHWRRCLTDKHQHVYRQVNAFIVNVKIIIGQDICKVNVIVRVFQYICQSIVPVVILSRLHFYWDDLPILNYDKIQLPLLLAVEVMQFMIISTIGSSHIRKEQAAKIEALANWLNANPDFSVAITRYADKETGTAKGNMELSQKRSEAVRAQ